MCSKQDRNIDTAYSLFQKEKIMKIKLKSCVLALFSAWVFLFTAHAYESTSNVVGLSQNSNGVNSKKGFAGATVDKSFFTKDTSSYMADGTQYYTTISINKINQINKLNIELHNSLNDGKPYPVIVSIAMPHKKFKNYIVEFTENSNILFDITREIKNLDIAAKNDLYSPVEIKSNNRHSFSVNLICSTSFEGSYSVNDEESKVFEVTKPKLNNVSLASNPNDDHNRCCLSTSGQKIQVVSKHNQTGQQSVGWIKVDRSGCNGTYCNIRMTAYYPTSNDVLHRPDESSGNFINQRCQYRWPGGTQFNYKCDCGSEDLCMTLYTLNGYGSQTQKIQWMWMVKAVYPGYPYPAECRVYEGPGLNQSWEIYYNGY